MAVSHPVGDRNAEEDAMGAQVSIGDFAVMTSLSRKALRHYHDIGILEPAHIDPHTGYRFYDTSQVDHAHIIRRFRSLDMSIPDIKALLSTEDAAALGIYVNEHLLSSQGPIREHYLGGTPTDSARFTATEICWPIFTTTTAPR